MNIESVQTKTTSFGMGLILVTLTIHFLYYVVSLTGIITGIPELEGLAAKAIFAISIMYPLAAAILTAPPIFAILADEEGDTWFPKQLVVLEGYLVILGLLVFVQTDFWFGLLLRGTIILFVCLILRYCLGLVRKLTLRNIWALHWDSVTGEVQQEYSFLLGVLWLGLGYSFLGTIYSVIMMTFGSYLLYRSAKQDFDETGAAISEAWKTLNLRFSIFGLAFIAMHIAIIVLER